MSAQLLQVRVELGDRSYSAFIGEGALSVAEADALARKAGSRHDVLVMASPVAKRWGDRIIHTLHLPREAVLVVPGNEAGKSWLSTQRLMERWAEYGVSRNDWVWVAGGGALSDLVGFAASVYQRGLAWVGIPTTWLSVADSCIGGKTGVNLASLKNYAGSFHQPRAVYCDTELLASLPARQRREGLAEVVKCALIGNLALIDYLESRLESLCDGSLPPEVALAGALAIKAKLVSEDEYDHGVRQFLNFGHTIAHALEVLVSPRPSHGHAVAQGMRLEARLANLLGLLDKDELRRAENLLDRLGLPFYPMPSLEQALPVMWRDKKRQHQGIPFALPAPLGTCQVMEVEKDKLAELWRSFI